MKEPKDLSVMINLVLGVEMRLRHAINIVSKGKHSKAFGLVFPSELIDRIKKQEFDMLDITKLLLMNYKRHVNPDFWLVSDSADGEKLEQ